MSENNNAHWEKTKKLTFLVLGLWFIFAFVVHWFAETVSRSVAVEFDRYIDAGDLQQAKERIEQIQAASDESGGFVGMYL